MGSNKKHTVGGTILGSIGNIFRVIAALIMVGIITGCIVASVLTVYILRYINADETITLDDVTMRYTTTLYYYDETGAPLELQSLQTAENRIKVEYDQIPQHMKDAVIAIEDKRFMDHHGVDWQRTAGAFINMFVPIYPTQAGGSTITQQLIKNITGEKEFRIERKVQEIFRALKLEQMYTKEQILEAYMTTVFFSNQAYGVQAAANTYFGKDVSELTIAESASIIGITNFPTAYNPFLYPENNKVRQEHILREMFEQGKITQKEYDDAVAEKLVFQKDAAMERVYEPNDYFVDNVIEEVLDDLVEEKGYTIEYAQQMLYGGGYRIYTTVDTKIQEHLNNFYLDSANFPQQVYNATFPQSACVITDLNGKILGLVGGIGEKTGSRQFNRATQALRQCGSAIKPLAAYMQGIDRNVVNWSTMIDDTPMQIPDPNVPGKTMSWPVNFNGYLNSAITVDQAMQQSRNTVAAKVVNMVSPQACFDFMKHKIGFDSLIEREVINGNVVSDVGLSSMALGGMTYGVTLLEMAGGYQVIGNGGTFTKPYSYTEVRDAEDNIVLKKDITPRRVIPADTATILNKLTQRVTAGPNAATGTDAKMPGELYAMPIAGKTGTTSDDKDQWFMGVTPYYVCGIWLGYDQPERIRYGAYPPPLIWKAVMTPVHEGLEVKDFPVWGEDDVVQLAYCTTSGELAVAACPGRSTGWYRKSFTPSPCAYHSGFVESQDLGDRQEEKSSNSKKNGGSSSKKDGGIIKAPAVVDNED